MARGPGFALSKHSSRAWRMVKVLTLAVSSLAMLHLTGCAWWQDPPPQPRTVTDWMKQPRVEP
jgi:hypothetical protein